VFDGYWLGKTRHIVRLPENGTSWAKTAVGRKAVTSSEITSRTKAPLLDIFQTSLQIINL